MSSLVHIIIFLASIVIVWFFAGVVIESVSRVARRYCRSGFITAFFILGALTSISEFSVAINSALGKVPQVSVGNLAGASFVILLFIVPSLAAFGRGIHINAAISKRSLILMLCSIVLPVLLVIDGNVTRTEGSLAILAYGTVAYALYRQRESIRACDLEDADMFSRIRATAIDVGRIIIGGVAIFAAAHFLVEQAVYFAQALSIPTSLVGLVLLSLGTNIPELVIAARSILSRRADIALGDYLGSAMMNTFIFGALALGVGTFAVEASEFVITAILFVSGLALFYIYSRSGRILTKREGAILLGFYAAFLILQLTVILRLS